MDFVSPKERFKSLEEVIELLERHKDDVDAAQQVVRRVGYDLNYVAHIASGFGLSEVVDTHLQAVAAIFTDFFRQLTFRVQFPTEEEEETNDYPYLHDAGHPIARAILSRIPLVLAGNPDLSFAEAMGAIYFDNPEAKTQDPIIRRYKNPDGTHRIVRVSDQVALYGDALWTHSPLYEYLQEAGNCLVQLVKTPQHSRRGVTSILRWAESIEDDAALIIETLQRWGIELEKSS